MSFDSAPHDRVDQAAAIRREALQIGALILAAVAAFFVTRSVAASNREMSLRDAAEWYRRGESALAARRIDAAVEDFRRATVRDRTNKRYVLALARALADMHDEEAARAALLAVRESAPEDPEINLELARLAAARQDVTEAQRFYHNALYAPWPPERSEDRRRIRLELIGVLLDHGQGSRAIAELLAMATDLPDDVPHHLQVAELFARAGDAARALRQFEDALRIDAGNAAALEGAGQAAFTLGDYRLARRHLRRRPQDRPETRSMLEIADLVLSRDPLANRIGALERRRRFGVDFDYAEQRLQTCLATPGATITAADSDLQGELAAFRETLQTPALDQDSIESGIDLIDRVERRVAERCAPMTTMDQALRLIARQHGGDTP